MKANMYGTFVDNEILHRTPSIKYRPKLPLSEELSCQILRWLEPKPYASPRMQSRATDINSSYPS